MKFSLYESLKIIHIQMFNAVVFFKSWLKIMFGGLVYISVSINIYTTAFQNECQPLIESKQDFLLPFLQTNYNKV